MKPERINYPDGSHAQIEVGEHGCVWDLCLPNGKHERGIEDDMFFARAAVMKAHDRYVLKVWEHGKQAPGIPGGPQTFVVPLA